MNHFSRGFLIIFLLTLTFNGFAQSKIGTRVVKPVTYNDNVNLPLSSQERDFLEEVYADKLDEYILSMPQRLRDVKDILRNRVKIEMASQNEKSAYMPLLSTVPLFDNYNKKITRDITFDKYNFNPLKYQFHFHGFGYQMFRIDNTDYVVTIRPQNR